MGPEVSGMLRIDVLSAAVYSSDDGYGDIVT